MSQILDQSLILYHRIVQDLAFWKPHNGQIRVGQSLFTNNIRNIFVMCGRKWGKTELAMYILWRWGMMFPGRGCFYVAPELKQGKKIVWEDPRLENFGPRHWIKDVNHSDTRVELINGSYLKLDGSENFESHRGTRPSIVIYEEFKDHDPRFRNIMRPNLSVYQAPEVFLGTPPENECEYTAVMREHQTHPTKLFYQAPTWENPQIDRKWLFDEKKRLYQRGDGDSWEREYAAKYVKGGSSKIFPMWDESFIVPHDTLMQMLIYDKKKLHWFWWNDPAGATCFATLFAALNPYTKHWYLLDEIYEKRQMEMTAGKLGKRAIAIRNELYEREWRQGYDEAATWFANEMMDQFDEALEPSHKHLHDKAHGLSLIKDIMLARKITVSDRCKMWHWEVDNYFKDKNGNIPKKNDHLIDDFRYILGAAGYELREEIVVHPDSKKGEDFRGARIEDDFPHLIPQGEDLSEPEAIRLWKSL